jgi:hypothetical protein
MKATGRCRESDPGRIFYPCTIKMEMDESLPAGYEHITGFAA